MMKMKLSLWNIRQLHNNRRGLTLMELVVVMTVLAALSAIALPLFPNLLRRAHKVTDATQTSETAKAVQLYQGLNLAYPNNFDLLTDGTTFPAFIPEDDDLPFGNYVTAQNLTEDELKALIRVGVDSVQRLASDDTPAGFHPTRNPYAGTVAGDAIPLGVYEAAGADPDAEPATGALAVKFAVLNKAAITNGLLQAEIAADPAARYVVFGVGARSQMIGTVLQDAPTSIPQNKSFTPDTLYSRVGVIFKVSGAEVSRTERARFIAAVAMEDDELESTEKDLVGYYEVARGTN